MLRFHEFRDEYTDEWGTYQVKQNVRAGNAVDALNKWIEEHPDAAILDVCYRVSYSKKFNSNQTHILIKVDE